MTAWKQSAEHWTLSMSSTAFVGDGNYVGTLTNVGNQTTNIYPPHERKPFPLESRVSFDALLKSGARYPAPKCHPGTREKAQKVVKNWLCQEGEGSEKGIMWMSGAPGVGKSAIAQTVCEELCGDDGSTSWLSNTAHSERHVDGCFFFTRGFENRENASFFPATIAFQLRRSREYCRMVIDAVIEERPEILGQDFSSQFRQLLTKAAQTAGTLQGPVTVVIDGLDECNSAHDQITLLGLILEAVKTGNMRFFIASRPEQQIHTFFHRPDVAQHTYHVRLDEETFQTSHDIKTFLREEFARIRRRNPDSCHRLPNGEEWPGERVLDHLTLGSDSQFMFPTLAVGFIDTEFYSPARQLQILMESPPSCAFSALDNLYHKILSRQPPAHLLRGEEDLREYQEVVKGILRVIIAWTGKPLSAADIAVVLDKPSDIVQRIIHGPMRPLFKFHTSEADSPITLCHKSLRDYLLARDRSQEFFIPSTEEDDLFIALLSRCPTSHPLHPDLPALVMDILSFLFVSDTYFSDDPAYMTRSVPRIAEFLGVHSTLVNYVVHIGPTRLLFDIGHEFEEVEATEDNDGENIQEEEERNNGEEEDNEEHPSEGEDEVEDEVHLCTEAFRDFLQDWSRSGPFFVYDRRTDSLFLRALSHPPPSNSGSSYAFTRATMLDIMAVIKMHAFSSISRIAAFLELDSRLVEDMVMLGPIKWLVSITRHHEISITNSRIDAFLGNGDRSGEFYISERRLDRVSIPILSKQLPFQPLYPSFYNILMGVLTALTVQEKMTIHDIARLLSIHWTFVEGVVKLGPTNLLFSVDRDEVSFFTLSFASFFEDSKRSGPFFISTSRIDTFLLQFLSRRPTHGTPILYSRDDLLNILAFTLPLGTSASTHQIAAFLNVDCDLVEHVVKFGEEKWMFRVDEENGSVYIVGYKLKIFLQQADRSGPFFVSDKRLDPFFVKILSQQPPFNALHSEVSSHEMILRVLTAILAFEGSLTIEGIASVISVDRTLVEGVVKVGPTRVLCAMPLESSKVTFLSGFLGGFLQDADRSGNFFVPQGSIDNLFLRILSKGTISLRSVHPHPKELLLDVLSAMTIESAYSFGPTARGVAAFLDIDSVLVDAVVSGPAKYLFGVRDGRIWLSTKQLRPFLQDVDRAGPRLCTTNTRMDDLFIRFLSRQLPPNLPYSHTQHTLKTFLAAMAHTHEGHLWTVPLLSAFLDVNPTAIEGAINGPSWLPVSSNWRTDDFIVFPPLLQHFLKDEKRSGRFFVSDKSLDLFFSRILTPPLHLAGASSQPQDVLRGVLSLILIAQEGWLTVPETAAVLDVDASVIDSVVKAGLTKSLFSISWEKEIFTFATTSLASFLRDPDRSKEFCITDRMIDALFIRILSLPPPPHLATPPSTGDILRVIAVILASPESLTAPKIATLLGIDRVIVEGVVEIMPTNVLFKRNGKKMLFETDWEDPLDKLGFSGPFLKPFLHDPHRSGEFFISPTITLDEIPELWPQYPSNSPQVRASDSRHLDSNADERESPLGESAEKSEVVALPSSTVPKRKFSHLAPSRQASRDSESANEVAASPSTPVRTKRPKTTGALVLDSSEEPQASVCADSANDPEAEFNCLIGAFLSLAPSPQDLVGGAPDLDLGDEEDMVMEDVVVGDDETWGAEAVGDDDGWLAG